MLKRLILVALAAAAAAHGQSVTANMQRIQTTDVWALIINWTAASDGTVPPTAINSLTPTASILGFRIVSAEFTPKTPNPTNHYNVQLQDSAQVDMLGGGGASLSSTVASSAGQSIGAPPMFGTITFVMTANSVANAQGQVIIYFAPVQAYSVFGATGPPGPAGTSGTVLPNASDQLTYLRIQPNTGNLTTYGYAALTYANPADYSFTPFTPVGNLNIGNTTVTFPIVPRGTNGTDTNHYMYVSGGTGGAEACLITGGSGTSGQINGSITLQCANAHSGAFTVGTATAGLQEAWNIYPFLQLYPGNYNIFAAVTPPTNGAIACNTSYTYGSGGVHFKYNAVTGNMFNIINDGFSMTGGCILDQVGTAVSSIGIYLCGVGCAGPVHTANNYTLDNVKVYAFYDGIYVNGGGGNAQANNLFISGNVNHGIVIGSGQGHWNDVICAINGGDGVHFQLADGPGGGGSWFSGYQSFGNSGWGMSDAVGGVYLGGEYSYFNNDQLGGIYINGYGSQINHVTLQYEGLSVTGLPFSTNTTAPGIFIDTGGSNANITDVLIYQNQGKCLYIAGSQNRIVNVNANGCGVGGNATNFSNYAVHLPNTGQENQIVGSSVIGSTTTNQNDLTLVGNQFLQASATLATLTLNSGTNIQVSGNTILQTGAAPALACGSVFITDSANTVSGTTSGICARAANSAPMSPILQFITSFANLASVPGPVQGDVVYLTDGVSGQNPCSSGGGNGSLAYYDATGHWNCGTAGGGGSSNYQTIQNNGVSVATEPTLNFIPGSNVTLGFADVAGVKTNVTINATGGGGGGTIEPGQTGSDFGLAITTTTTANDTLTVNAGNWIFGGNNFVGTNSCNFTLNAGTGTGVGDVWLSRSGFVTLQYTNTGSQTVVISGTSTNCVATGAATPAFPADGSKYIGSVGITGTKTWGAPLVQYAFAGANYLTTCTLPLICTISGDTVNVSGSSPLMQTNTANSATAASSFDFSLTTGFKVPFITSTGNCSSAASPAVCGSSMAGSVVVAAAATTVVVNTTAVTAASQILLTFDSSLGTKLSVTCNTTFDQPWISARTAATSFTITITTGPTTNPACYSYQILN